MAQSYKRLKLACYVSNISMSVISNLSPLLFLTFHSLYGISYSLLGLLVLVGFFTQLIIDLIFSFFSHKFNIARTVKFTPLLTVAGLVLYAVLPWVFEDHAFVGILVGTLLFSASGGLSEVLLTPTVAAIPAEDPDSELSKLHSIYAWGVVAIVILATLFLLIFGVERWQYLALLLALIPLFASLLYAGAPIPHIPTPERASGALQLMKNKGLWLFVAGIFLGGAAECTMSQWASGYLELALGIPKIWGDVFGVALFALMLGLGRTLYAKFGKSICKFLLLGAIGATLCYLVAALSPFPVVGLLACALTGFCVSMLWPGSLIAVTNRFPAGGVFVFALMAAGGDLGASIGPQLVGLVTDAITAAPSAVSLSQRLSLSPEQLGLKAGMLLGALFPLCAIAVFAGMLHNSKKSNV